MKVEIIRNTVADGRDVFVGDKPDLKPETAKLLIGMGKARPFVAQPVVETAAVRPPVETASAAPTEAAAPAKKPASKAKPATETAAVPPAGPAA